MANTCESESVPRKRPKRQRTHTQIEYIEVEDNNVQNTNNTKLRDTSTQVNYLKSAQPSFYDLLKTDKDLSCWTGIPNNSLLLNIEKCVKQVKLAANTIKDLDLSVRGLIILVLVRLKVNLSFDQMAVIFKQRPIYLSKCFAKFLPILKGATESTVFISTCSNKKQPTTQRNLTRYQQDECTDIEIVKPKVLIMGKIDAHSNYKGEKFI